MPEKLLGGLAVSLLLTGSQAQDGPRQLDFAEANRRAVLPTWISLRAEEFDTADRAGAGGPPAPLGPGPTSRATSWSSGSRP